MAARSRPRPRAPSFIGFTPSSAASSRAKQANRAVDTKSELLLRRALWTLGLRYRKNVTRLPGKPDVVFPAARIAVFCDGDFWHGRDWRHLKRKLRNRANSAYWVAKIAANRIRDTRHQQALQRAGWRVIRVWETDVTSNPEQVAAQINSHVERQLLLIKLTTSRRWQSIRNIVSRSV